MSLSVPLGAMLAPVKESMYCTWFWPLIDRGRITSVEMHGPYDCGPTLKARLRHKTPFVPAGRWKGCFVMLGL